MDVIKTVGFRSDDAKTVGFPVGLDGNGRMGIKKQTIEVPPFQLIPLRSSLPAIFQRYAIAVLLFYWKATHL